MSNLVETLDLIGHLDFEPGCQSEQGCDQTAKWFIYFSKTCGCPIDPYAMCDECARLVAKDVDRWSDGATCSECWTDLGPNGLRIDRIEPLR